MEHPAIPVMAGPLLQQKLVILLPIIIGIMELLLIRMAIYIFIVMGIIKFAKLIQQG